MSELTRAIELACLYHNDQVDKQGQPYILHCLRVGMAFNKEQYQVVGILHDILEDTGINPSFLKSLITDAAFQAVTCLTRSYKESYDEYIHRVSLDPLATRIKIVDLFDNLSRIHQLVEKDQRRLRPRYTKALAFLRRTLVDQGADLKEVLASNRGVIE